MPGGGLFIGTLLILLLVLRMTSIRRYRARLKRRSGSCELEQVISLNRIVSGRLSVYLMGAGSVPIKEGPHG